MAPNVPPETEAAPEGIFMLDTEYAVIGMAEDVYESIPSTNAGQ